MEVYAVAILAGAGYLISRLKQQKAGYSVPIDSAVTPQVLAADAPSQQNTWESRRFQDVLVDEQNRAADLTRRALDPASTGVVSRSDRAIWSGMATDEPPPGPPRVYSALLGREVPVESFTHNNMQPFYRGTLKQPLADDAFSARLEVFTGAFDDVRPLGARKEGGTLFTPEPQGEMNSSGRPVAGDYDRARESFFETQQPRNRANELPPEMQPEIVGRPGVRGGETGDVFYDAREALLQGYKSVDELRASSRPKLTFEGRVLPGAAATTTTARPDLPDVQADLRYGGPVTRELGGVDDLLRTTGATIAETLRPEDLADIRWTNRQTTSADTYLGPAGRGGILSAESRGWVAGGAPLRHGLGAPPVGVATPAASGARSGDYGRGSILVYGNNRDVTTLRTHQGNLVSAIKALVAPVTDALRPTRKEDAVDAPRAFGNTGNPAVPKPAVYDPEDVPRTTLKEAMLDDGGASLANATLASGPPRPTVQFDPDTGVARTTLKESTLAATPAANLACAFPPRGVVYDPDDVARVARRQTTLAAAPSVNLRGDRLLGVAYDPEDVARATTKQSTLAAAPAANLRGDRLLGVAYDPEDVARATTKQSTLAAAPSVNLRGGAYYGAVHDSEDVARATTKQSTLAAAPSANLRGGAYYGTVYDSEDVARATRKQTTLAAAAAANLRGGAFLGAAHDPEDVARTTRKEMTLQEAPQANLRGDSRQGTVHHDDRARTTTREATSPIDSTRNMARAAPTAGSAYNAEDWAPRTTMREASDSRGDLQDGSVGGLQGLRGGAYATTEYDARATQRQVADATEGTAYGVAASRERPGAYTSTEFDARPTQKEALSDRDYYGGVAGSLAQTSGDSADAMISRSGDDREAVAAGREPTPQGAKVGTEQGAMGAFAAHGTGGLGRDQRSPSPGRAAPLPAAAPALLREETRMLLGRAAARVDPDEHGASTLTGDRLADLAAANAEQRRFNDTAQPTWAPLS